MSSNTEKDEVSQRDFEQIETIDQNQAESPSKKSEEGHEQMVVPNKEELEGLVKRFDERLIERLVEKLDERLVEKLDERLVEKLAERLFERLVDSPAFLARLTKLCPHSNELNDKILTASTKLEAKNIETEKEAGKLVKQDLPLPDNKSEKVKMTWFYSEDKLFTEQTLKKLQEDLGPNYEIECLLCFQIPKIRDPKAIFLFYFVTDGREQIQNIRDCLDNISSRFPTTARNLIILKDFAYQQTPVDLSPLKTIIKPNVFNIYYENYGDYFLSSEFIKSKKSKNIVPDVKENYEKLMEAVK